MNSEIEALQAQIQALKLRVRHVTMENAIHDETDTPQPIDVLANYIECEFYSDYLILAVVHARADRLPRPMDAFPPPVGPGRSEPAPGKPMVYYPIEAMEAAEEILKAALAPKTYYMVFRSDQDMGILLNPNAQFVSDASIQTGDYYRNLTERFSEILTALNKALGFQNTVSLSAIHQGHASLRQMYLEAKNTYDYSWNLNGPIHTYPELCASPLSPEDQRAISALEQEFMGDINHLLFFEASMVLDSILQRQFYHTIPLREITVAVTARLRNVLAVLEATMGVEPSAILDLESLVSLVTQSGSIPELRDRIHDFFASLANFPPRQSTQKGPLNLEFLEANYQNPALSAQMICDRFRISRTYLSRLIKNETGQGLVDCIHDIRVQHTKQLLAETSLPVEQLALQVGFSNRYGLIRAFRSLEGISPSEYRRKALEKRQKTMA